MSSRVTCLTSLVLASLLTLAPALRADPLPSAHKEKLTFLAMNELSPEDAQVIARLLASGFFDKVHTEWKSLEEDTSPGEEQTNYEIKELVKRIGLPVAREKYTPFNGNETFGNYSFFDPCPRREGILRIRSKRYWELPVCQYKRDGYSGRWIRVATITVDVQAQKIFDAKWD